MATSIGVEFVSFPSLLNLCLALLLENWQHDLLCTLHVGQLFVALSHYGHLFLIIVQMMTQSLIDLTALVDCHVC